MLNIIENAYYEFKVWIDGWPILTLFRYICL